MYKPLGIMSIFSVLWFICSYWATIFLSIEKYLIYVFICLLFLALQEMSRAEELWVRLVRSALRSQGRSGTDVYGRADGGIAANVPSSLANNRDIDDILRAADEIQDEDPNISRICMLHIVYHLPQISFLFLFFCFYIYNDTMATHKVILSS